MRLGCLLGVLALFAPLALGQPVPSLYKAPVATRACIEQEIGGLRERLERAFSGAEPPPPPEVMFEDFGDNALAFGLYFWIKPRMRSA